MSEIIDKIEVFAVDLPTMDVYLGTPSLAESVAGTGYIIRSGNRTIYPRQMRSVAVRVTLASGQEGWGETYGLVAPEAVAALIADVIAPAVAGRSPFSMQVIWDDLYDLMRVRGYTGGFWLDAISAVDIALWDLAGRLSERPLYDLLGGRHRERIPAYVSGLPRDTIAEKCELARAMIDRGFSAIKIAAVVSGEGVEREIAALRDALGPKPELMVDCHWMYHAADAIGLARRLQPYGVTFMEAPCKTEDIAGLAMVAEQGGLPVAAGEEWRTVHDALPRLRAAPLAIVQPEMGHTGITQFMRIATLAQAHHARIAPHATIGVGIFAAASLHASATLLSLTRHEYQHSVFHHGADLMNGRLECEDGYFALPEEPGLGIAPNATFWERARKLA